MEIALGGQTYNQPAVNLNSQRCVNLYPILDPMQTSISTIALRHTPGLVNLGSHGGLAREYLVYDDDLYAIIDNRFSKVVLDLPTNTITSITSLGTLNTSSGFAEMARNSDTICMIDGPNYYLFTPGTGVFRVGSSLNFVEASSVTSIDGYFLFSQAGTAVMFHTELSDPDVIDGLNFATAETKPDRLVKLTQNSGELWAFGESSVEIWYDAANPQAFAFSPRRGAVVNQGCAAGNSVTQFNNTLVWLDNRRKIVMANGYNLERISTDPIEVEIRRYDRVDDAVFFSYNFEGHEFLVCEFPSADVTWSFDAQTALWHERTSIVNNVSRRYLAQLNVSYQGADLVSSWNSNGLYRLDSSVYTEDGQYIERMRTLQPITDENKWRGISYFEVYTESGIGLQEGQGSNPLVELTVSKDGGHTYGVPLQASIGRIGKYKTRLKWNRLGTSRNWIFKLRITDPVPITLMNGYIQVDGVS